MRPRILVADDEELERRALRRILGGAGAPGYEVVEAANGPEALARAGEGPLDLAFLDIQMPGIDGMETARLLRERMPGLPIVFLTAYDRFEYARGALRLRVEDFLLKPASAEEVLAAVGRAFNRAREDSARADTTARVDEDSAARIGNLAAWLAAEIREELATGRVDGEGFRRWLGLGGPGDGGEVAAVLAFRIASPGGISGDRGLRLLREAARLAERHFGAGSCLAGAGAGQGLCLLGAPLPVLVEESFRAFLDRAREELGLSLAVGVAQDSVAQDSVAQDSVAQDSVAQDSVAQDSVAQDGAAVAGPATVGAATKGATATDAAELARAARLGSAVAGLGKPLLMLHPLGRPALLPATGPAGSSAAASVDGGSERRLAWRALELMDERLAEDISLGSAAESLDVSPSHLSRILGRQVGAGFADCLARLRVGRASVLLAGTRGAGTLSAGGHGAGLSVKEVAALVGFRDPAYFARVFRRKLGASPNEFRRLAVESHNLPAAVAPAPMTDASAPAPAAGRPPGGEAS